jgi:DNA replication protein DnaC
MTKDQDLQQKFKELRLKNCADNIEDLLRQGAEKNLSSRQIIERLLDLEIENRRQGRMELRFRQSKLREKTTIEQFDFNHHHSRKKQKNRILGLMDLTFIQEKKNIIFIGNPGTGKSFLAKAMGFAATQSGIKTLFTSTVDMINQLTAAEKGHDLIRKLKTYQTPDLLICDEIGYLPLGLQGSNLFFQVISARDEHKSTIITTNLPFAQWGTIFDSTTSAAAIADRLVHKSEILIMEGESYRKKG